MQNNKNSQMDKWIETRLTSFIRQNETIRTEQILMELESFFKIKITNANVNTLKKKIRKIRIS